MAITKSGGSAFHGSGFEFYRNQDLQAKQWGDRRQGAASKKNFGVNIRRSAKIGALQQQGEELFLLRLRGYREQGGSNRPTLSIPSLAERNGDFRDWRDAAGN